VAQLRAGSMVFYDSTRPYTLEFDDSFRQLVIQVPRSAVPRARVREATATALSTTVPGRASRSTAGAPRRSGRWSTTLPASSTPSRARRSSWPLLIIRAPNPVVVDRSVPTMPAFIDADELETATTE
jgi:hypothetical protein